MDAKRARLCAAHKGLIFFIHLADVPALTRLTSLALNIQNPPMQNKKRSLFDALCLPLIPPEWGRKDFFVMTFAGRLGISVWKAV